MRRISSVTISSAALASLLAACGGGASSNFAPGGTTLNTDRTYPGPCSSVELDVVETAPPTESPGTENLGDNSLEVVATFRPGEPIEDPRDVVTFLERRQREDDVQAQVQQQTFTACAPEPASTTGQPERLPPQPAPPTSSESKPVAPAPEVAPRTQ